MNARRSLVLSLVLVSTGCGIHTEYIPMNTPPRPLAPRPPEQVEMFSSQKPSRPYVEVGTIEVQQQAYNGSTASSIVTTLRAEGGRRGCDGLVMLGANDALFVAGSSGPNGGSVSSRTLKGYRASCIVYTEPMPPPAPPSAPSS